MIIYHNSRCSKSRQTLALLREHGVEPEIVEYLKNPLTADEIEMLISKLGADADRIVRVKDALYKELGLKGLRMSPKQTAQILAENPKLIERPIVEIGSRAALGRPPENVLSLLSL